MDTLHEILKSLGIPNDNQSMSLQGIIDSVLKKNHPDIPEYSDISNQKLSVIDDSKKATITLLEPNLPPFFSNILVLRKDEKDSLAELLFRKFTYKRHFLPNTTISASFVIPKNEKMEQVNKEAFSKINPETKVGELDDTCLSILLELIHTTKGIVEVSIEDGNGVTETLSVLDLMGLVQMN